MNSTATDGISGAPREAFEDILSTVWAALFLFTRDRPALFCCFLVCLPTFLTLQEVFPMKKVAIVMGSASDLPVVEKAIETLETYGIPHEAHVYSAHRTPVEAKAFAENAREAGFGAIIAAAGKAAHLAGAIAANTTLPVIGIPVKSSTLDGLDALLSTVQMPAGIPVATVAIDGAANAALLAAQIIAVEDAELAQKLTDARKKAAEDVLKKDAEIAAKYSK